MTEEATAGNTWSPDTRTLKIISRAAFEVDDYWRIVEILHKRFLSYCVLPYAIRSVLLIFILFVIVKSDWLALIGKIGGCHTMV